MSSHVVRPFRRSDREQLTMLVRGHVDAVIPGVSVSVNRVLAQLEREPGEFIVDPWVIERRTLVTDRRKGVATWLVGHAADWLQMGGVKRVLAYSRPEEEVSLEFLCGLAFRELTRTTRGWVRA